MHPSPTRAQEYQMDDPCYHIGGGVTQIDIKIKNSMCGISRSPTQDTSDISYKWYLQVDQSIKCHSSACVGVGACVAATLEGMECARQRYNLGYFISSVIGV